MKKRKKFKFIPGIIRRDFFRKFIALFFAYLLWVVVQNKIGIEQDFHDIKVNISHPPSLYLFKNNYSVIVKLKGSERTLKSLSSSDIKIQKSILIDQYIEGESITIHLKPSDVKVPSSVQVVHIDNPAILIEGIDKAKTKTVDIIYKLKNTPLTGYTLGDVTLKPNKVEITGPKTKINGIRSVETEPIDIQIKNSFRIDDLSLVQKSKDIAFTKNSTVSAEIEILNKYATRIFQKLNIRLFLSDVLEKKILSPQVVNVTLHGLKSVIETIQPKDIIPNIDLSNYEKAGNYKVKVECWINGKPNIQIKSITPSHATVNCSVKK